MSGGGRQRVVVARALAPEPSVLVADEPVSMLDMSIRAEIVALLDELVRKRDLAMLYLTHGLLSARLLPDDVLVPGLAAQITEHRTTHGGLTELTRPDIRKPSRAG